MTTEPKQRGAKASLQAPTPEDAAARPGKGLTLAEMEAAAMTDAAIDAEYQARAREAREEDARWYEQLRLDAQAVYRAMDGWKAVRGAESAEAWADTVADARERYRSGRFLIERLGAERYLDPQLMATLWGLRQRLVANWGARGAHERMLIDAVVMSYYHMLRFHGWIGNFALQIEHEFFGQQSPTAKFQERYRGYNLGELEGLRVEDYVHRVGEQLLPLMDRANRIMIRNLKALRDLRQLPTPAVAIGQAGQVNVGAQQMNVAQAADRQT